MFICSGVFETGKFCIFICLHSEMEGGEGFAARDNSRLSRGFLLFILVIDRLTKQETEPQVNEQHSKDRKKKEFIS
jgi:hypothetical protein